MAVSFAAAPAWSSDDGWALACVRMWQGLSDGAIIRRLASGVLPSPPADAPNADQVLRRICRRALDPVPTNRYATAAEMQYELEGWLKRHGDDVTARMVGNFVAMSFDKERTAVKALLEYVLGPGQDTAASLDFAKLPDALLEKAKAQVDKIQIP